MMVCGRRVVVVPGAQAFRTKQPTRSWLGADETVVYVIDVISIP